MTSSSFDIRRGQKPSGMPVDRYRAYPPIDLPDRVWPTRAITEAPRWL